MVATLMLAAPAKGFPADKDIRLIRNRSAGESIVSDQIVYGIIDHDYARVFTQARIVAWQYGYACVMHGSFTRDLDLLLVPWTDKAVANGDQLLQLIAQGCGLRFRDGKEDINTANVDWSDKPHGRKACSLFFPEFGDRRWIDISIFEPTIAELERENEALREENTKLRLMLATSIAGSSGYFDDGEMQDSSRMPMIDFKRFTPDQIRDALAERAAIALKEQSNVPR
jgi:hypothetical protein